MKYLDNYNKNVGMKPIFNIDRRKTYHQGNHGKHPTVKNHSNISQSDNGGVKTHNFCLNKRKNQSSGQQLVRKRIEQTPTQWIVIPFNSALHGENE